MHPMAKVIRIGSGVAWDESDPRLHDAGQGPKIIGLPRTVDNPLGFVRKPGVASAAWFTAGGRARVVMHARQIERVDRRQAWSVVADAAVIPVKDAASAPERERLIGPGPTLQKSTERGKIVLLRSGRNWGAQAEHHERGNNTMDLHGGFQRSVRHVTEGRSRSLGSLVPNERRRSSTKASPRPDFASAFRRAISPTSSGRAQRGSRSLEDLLTALATLITGVIAATGYAGVMILMAIESACIPLPSEIIMPFAGSLVASGRMSLVGLATAGALGCNLGSAVAYAVGATGGRAAIERWGPLVLLSKGDLDWSERFFVRYGGITVLVSRLLPVVRTFIALPAGMARMPMLRFHIYTFVGSWPWCFGLAYVGAKLGERWNQDPTLRATFHRFDAIILVAIVAAGTLFVWHRVKAIRSGTALPPGRGEREPG